MSVGTLCNIPDCEQRRLRGYLFCWSHQMDLELVDLVAQTDSAGVWIEDSHEEDFLWVCPHGSIMGDCYLSGGSEFPGVGPTVWEIRTEMTGITLNLN